MAAAAGTPATSSVTCPQRFSDLGTCTRCRGQSFNRYQPSFLGGGHLPVGARSDALTRNKVAAMTVGVRSVLSLSDAAEFWPIDVAVYTRFVFRPVDNFPPIVLPSPSSLLAFHRSSYRAGRRSLDFGTAHAHYQRRRNNRSKVVRA